MVNLSYKITPLRNRFMYYCDINDMGIFYSKSCDKISVISIFMVIILTIMTTGILSASDYLDEKSLVQKIFAQISKSLTNSSSISAPVSDSNSKNNLGQNESKTIEASGHFANNQMKDGEVTWIQGGFWNLEIVNSSNANMENTNANATFDANFTMIRPDGSLSHNHVISNFTSTNVIFAGNDIVITGISHINSNNGTEYEEVPITIHLMGKRVLGLMIDVNKTGGHFAGSNEMFGTLISGIGLDNSTSYTNPIIDGSLTSKSNNTSNVNSVAHTLH